MSENRPDRPRSARISPRRLPTPDSEGRPSPTRRLLDEDYDDSFSEERYIGTSLPSWESQSFDSEERSRSSRPSSRMSLRDRRKQFDTTTPTLIDEEDELEEEEIMSLEQTSLQGFEPSMRRTPGASMYKSAFESDAETSSLRRTPGPSAMQQRPTSTSDQEKERGLGYALTLSTPAAGEEQRGAKPRTWESYAQSETPSPIQDRHSAEIAEQQGVRPPLPREAEERSQDTHGAFNFQPWTKERPGADQGSPGTGTRQGAFSPGLLRLTEDIGNLLQEDEDDDYTLEIPKVFRAEGGEVAKIGGDWTKSFVVDKSHAQNPVPRTSVSSIPRESRSRRKVVAAQSNPFPNAQQPMPRRSGNEVFEFGAPHGDDRASPQLLNFGGAFAPPAKDYSGSFTRPVAYAPVASQTGFFPAQGEQRFFSSQGQQPFQPAGPQQHPAFGAVRGGQTLIHAHSFDSFQSSNTRETPIDAYFQHQHLASPSPTAMGQMISFPAQPSDMHATAQEFVPMSTRSPTPLPQQAQWSQGAVPAPPYETSLEQAGWHHGPSFVFGSGYGYGIQSPSFGDTRSVMTPSPSLPGWQPGDSSFYSGTSQSRVDESQPTHFQTQHVMAPIGIDSTSRKKDSTRRVRRSKKKSQKQDSAVTKKAPPATAMAPAPVPSTVRKKTSDLRPSFDGHGDDVVSASEELIARGKSAEIDETPATRLAFKEFYKHYRSEEQVGVQRAEDFALKALKDGSIPESIHWRVYLELADLARRTNRFADARRLFQKVCQLQPYASQGWVEYSKLEEECGHMNRVSNILHAGLEFCEYNENLLIRALKHHEKIGNLFTARALLARLKHVTIDKVWRTILEGAAFEARAGNVVMARRVLKYIMHHVPWYGPLYVEFYRLERDHGHPQDALEVVENGLSQIPRYGPLWFAALRVCEEIDVADGNFEMPRTLAMLQRANSNVSKEIVWKVYLEASLLFERSAQEQAQALDSPVERYLAPARHYFALTIQTCRLNLRWKVWLAAARMELCAGCTESALKLFHRSHEVAPEKVRSLTFVDFARLNEFIGEIDLARAILCRGRVDYGHDWKVWLESVLLEMRSFNLKRAFELAAKALEVHHGTGRLWAALVQLSQFHGNDENQYAALRDALNAVPKSGEVWCEGARIHLNPFSDVFGLNRARRHLLFASKFTPQYGDSFLEQVRLELLDQWLSPMADYIWDETNSAFDKAKASKNVDCLTKYIADVSLAVSVARKSSAQLKDLSGLEYARIVPRVRKLLEHDAFHQKKVDLSETILACANADPNYGPLWFNCRRVQTDAPRRVIEHAALGIAEDLRLHAHMYLAAMVRRKAVLSTIEREKPKLYDEKMLEIFDSVFMDWEDRVDGLLRSYPSLREIFNPLDPTTGSVLVESTINGSDFVTGLMQFNKHRPIETMSLSDRKRAIFATDALFP